MEKNVTFRNRNWETVFPRSPFYFSIPQFATLDLSSLILTLVVKRYQKLCFSYLLLLRRTSAFVFMISYNSLLLTKHYFGVSSLLLSRQTGTFVIRNETKKSGRERLLLLGIIIDTRKKKNRKRHAFGTLWRHRYSSRYYTSLNV